MPTIVDILTIICIINTAFESLKARKVFIFQYFSFYEQIKFHAQLSWAWKSFITSRPGLQTRVCHWKSFFLFLNQNLYSKTSMARTLMAHSPGLARTIIIVLTGRSMHNPPWMAGTTLGLNYFSWSQASLSHWSSTVCMFWVLKKNCLNETVLLSTHNICLNWWVRK